ncbi:alkyl/aryl-sulfatase [Alisedimentitalea sp. MJ-SS2]|uniref:alkyl/aryl-sulfatase n=1 Tax=Aliisedimentitalea sp. MJ-SS2 TaxID=3049795 RepID=UPI00290C0C92|nr:alkyl/aryl-sulfatase [Alisedimentitalea sp. MJ-SS2]MDU8926183.1 alkyl/aryl-sulfatase [Alisedimentitalea sp. MJ-SS2]
MANEKLVHHNDTQFRKGIVELCPGFFSAVGYAASTQHMVVGDRTVTIIDTSESTGAAKNVLAAFRNITDKPVGRIIYTHSHRDHISGTTVFAEDRNVPIYAHHGFISDLVAQNAERIAPNKALGRRTMAQFGIGLTPQQRISLGCGPGDRPMEGLGAGFIPPTHMITQAQSLDLDGMQAEVIFAPGETPDHIALWFPETRVLIPGDNWYHAFPNLYAIRGTPYRDFQDWADTLAMLERLGAEVMAPGHTQPVFGTETISEVLTTTRAAILHVMQHTSDGMDAGLSLDDIAASIALPPEIANKPWLGEFYGKASWSARAFAVGTLGWYDGNPTHLGTLSSKSRAEHMAALAGGSKALLRAAKTSNDPQWTLELCDHLLALGEDAGALKAETMESLAEDEVNATSRNSYLWEAKRLREGDDS